MNKKTFQKKKTLYVINCVLNLNPYRTPRIFPPSPFFSLLFFPFFSLPPPPFLPFLRGAGVAGMVAMQGLVSLAQCYVATTFSHLDLSERSIQFFSGYFRFLLVSFRFLVFWLVWFNPNFARFFHFFPKSSLFNFHFFLFYFLFFRFFLQA